METETKSNSTPAWRATSVQGLYLSKDGIYYTRFRLNGSRTWRSLETKVFTVAKLKHAEKQAEVESERQKGSIVNLNFRTMGDLAEEFLRRLEVSGLKKVARRGNRYSLERLRAAWDGNFATAQARGVSLDDIFALRRRLQTMKWKVTRTKVEKTGYAPAVVNKTLGVLKLLLDIAAEKHVIASNPFSQVGALQENIFLPESYRVPQLPSRTDMERVFAEMLVVPVEDDDVAGRVAFFKERAEAAAEHAQFMAYSGMRWKEANAAMMEDDKGDTIVVRGTKSAASRRTVPVMAPLRKLIDRVKARGVTTGPILRCYSSRAALRRACQRLKLPVLRHHDMRHYFATVCIESGVDIPTVAGWLGHADGGALLMRTYNHLRQEHSVAAAKKVNFSASVQANAA
jgi:integrase